MSTTPNEPQNPNPIGGNQPGAGQPYPAEQQPAASYGAQGGKYGTAEYNPDQYTGMVERPSLLDRLLKLTLLSAGLYLLNGVLGAVSNSATDLEKSYRDLGMSTEQAADAASRAAGTGGIVGSIVALIIGLALYYLVYRGLKKGKNWARILGTVFAALSILGTLFSLAGSLLFPSLMFSGWGIVLTVLSVVGLVVDILWIVTAYKAPNNAYFAQNNRR